MQHSKAKSWFDASMWALMAFFVLLGVIAVWGCGAPTDEDLELLELEQTEQGITGRSEYGIRSDIAAPNEGGRCMPTTTAPTTHACNYPSSFTVTLGCGTGFTAQELADCKALLPEKKNALVSQFGTFGWTINHTETTGGGSCVVQKGNVSGASGGVDMRKYVLITPSGVGASLPEPTPAGYPGTHRLFSKLTGTVDWAKIESDLPTATSIQKSRAKIQAMNAVFAACMGVGWRTDVSLRWNSATFDINGVPSTNLDLGDQCRVRAWSFAGGSTLNIVTGC